jgi:hypothetical protein
MAKAKKTRPRELIRCRVGLITATPAKFVELHLSPDAATAEKQVAKEHNGSGATLSARPK